MAANNLRSALSESFEWFLLFTLLLIARGSLAAAEPSINPTTADQLKQLNDQTIIATNIRWTQSGITSKTARKRRLGLWEDCGGGLLVIRKTGAYVLSCPLAYYRTDQASDDDAIGGVGDAEIGTGTAFRLNDTWRTAGGIELHTDTASDRGLAEKVWRLKVGWGVAHDFTKWLSASFNANYNHSIVERGDARPQRYLELSLPATLIFPQAWSISAKYKTEVDFQNDNRWSHMVTAGVAKRLAKVPIVLSAALGKPLSGGAKEFQATVSIVYYFQRYHAPK